MKQLTVLIDPGHGGKDPGAISAGGLREADIVSAVGLKVNGILQILGHNSQLTRTGDSYPTLKARCLVEQTMQPDCFISLHCNAAFNRQARGIEVWTSPGDTAADPLARELFGALKGHFPGRRYRSDHSDGDPDKEGSLYVLKHTDCPAVLVEMGFLSNAEESHWLADEDTQNRMALAIVDGLLVWAEPKGGPKW
jgi:N-acetylmuramoyl-L-alanine amidase